MTTSISPAAGSTSTNPITTGSELGPVITDAPATGTSDTYTSAPAAPALPTSTATGTTTATPTTTTKKKRVKWSEIDSSLPFFKHLAAFFKANIAALKANQA